MLPKLLLSTAVAVFVAPVGFAQFSFTNEPTATFSEAQLTIINKKLGTSEPLTLKPNTLVIHNTLELQAKRCFTRNDSTAAWLVMTDVKTGQERFAGWLYADFPGASGLSDATYQIILNSCN